MPTPALPAMPGFADKTPGSARPASKLDRWPGSDALVPQLAAEYGDTCVLSFSRGKDSVGAWLALRPHFRRIIPVYGYRVPGLAFVERSLAYYERVFETPIVRLPHPALYRWLTTGFLQPPQRAPLLAATGLPVYTWDDVFRVVREDYRLPADTLVCLGVRVADSFNRRTAVARSGPVNRKRHQAFPVWDWTAERLDRELRAAGVGLPIDYQWFGRSFDGLQAHYCAAIARHAPEDWARICEWFPLAPVMLARYTRHWLPARS